MSEDLWGEVPRVNTATEFGLPLLLLKRSKSLMTWSTFFICLTVALDSSPLKMAIRYSKEMYSRIKGMKNEPLSQLVANPKRRKLYDEKGDTMVLGESLRLTIDYLNSEEKVMVANSRLKSVEAESSKLRKDLIEAMDETDKAKEKIKELSEALRVKKMLVIQKDEEIQAALLRIDAEGEKFIQYYKGFELLCRWMMKHHNQAVDFSNLYFEAKVLVDEAKEQQETTTTAVGERDAIDARRADLG
ncbi:hypothetical protein SO802_009136 [Lithocarpus litseifolius]|uniref:Uncharacterized protein n=1 Tax=Lithocarpus litseifolius TaxID=425828 RepID=A0AAW2DBL2_9ROSI